MSIKKNILKYIEHEGITKYKLYQITGITRGVLDNKGGMSEENIIKFLVHRPDISCKWLLTGQGEMFTNVYEDKISKTSDLAHVSENTVEYKIVSYPQCIENCKIVNTLNITIDTQNKLIKRMEDDDKD